MPTELIERLRPIWEAADAAFRTDPSYVTEMAKDGRPQPTQVGSEALSVV